MSQATILVVDDEPEILEIVSHMLSDYRVLCALNVDEAVAILKREPCSLVITDVRMPGATGLALVDYLKEKLPGTPVIVITGHGTAKSPAETKVVRWIAKPFRRAVILDVVREVLNGGNTKRLRDGDSVAVPGSSTN